MDLSTITELVRPRVRAQLPRYAPGDAFVAGGTWLFSEPQEELRRLIDLGGLDWPALEPGAAGLSIGATCTLATLEAFRPPPDWIGGGVIAPCCRALLGSFKIRHVATVGGNLCLGLPAAPMAALVVAFDGVCAVWTPDGGERRVDAGEFVTGARATALRPGEVLRSVRLPAIALRRRAVLRQMSLTTNGRSASLLIGTTDGAGLQITITAAVARPLRICLPADVTQDQLAADIDAAVPAWFDDVHGAPAWRRRITMQMAAELRTELLGA